MNLFFNRIGRISIHYRWTVVGIWVVGTIAAIQLLPSLGSQVNNNNSAFLPASAPSVKATALAGPLGFSPKVSRVVIVAESPNAPLDAADAAAITREVTAARRVSQVVSVREAGFSPDGRAVLVLVSATFSQTNIAQGKTFVDRLQTMLATINPPAGLVFHLAGAVATNVANQTQSKKTGKSVQLLSILFIIVLLFFVYRSLLAPIVTLLPAALVLALSGGIIGELGAHGLKISAVTQVLLIVLILGAGTDYGLFLVFRVREELRRGLEPYEAIIHALERVGESISASAGTVILALLSLLFATFGIYQGLGIPLAIGIAVMLAAGLTLLPAMLAIFGRSVFWPSRVCSTDEGIGVWGRVAGRVVTRPVLTLVVGMVIFGGLAAAATGYRSAGFGGASTAPAGSSAAAGNAALARYFPRTSANPTNLILSYATPVWADPAEVVAAARSLESSGRFTKLVGPLDPGGSALPATDLTRLYAALGPPNGLAPTPPPALPARLVPFYGAYRTTSTLVSPNGRTIQFEAGLVAGSPSSAAALHAVPALREALRRAATASGAVANGMAGEAPALYDVSATSSSDLIHIVPLAAFAIAVLLALVLRSLVAPLYLIASMVISYLAALGVAVVVFIDVKGDGGLTFLLPFLMFIFLLALGEDYNILVMTRIREEVRRLPLREAVQRAVGATGPTITAAGLVLAGTFAVLGFSGGGGPSGSQIQDIGFGLAVGILMDTFFVRTIMVPSMVVLLGRWNWWPSRLGRDEADALPGNDTSPAQKGQGK
ncbi:MAG: MMPL family transporter [Acidimicrobiales bacterium]